MTGIFSDTRFQVAVAAVVIVGGLALYVTSTDTTTETTAQAAESEVGATETVSQETEAHSEPATTETTETTETVETNTEE